MIMNIEKTLEIIRSGTVQVLPEQQLIKKLQSGKRLKVKLGMDPTAPDLHLGHAVVLQKLKQFQDLGHEVIFLIGDFTASIGDPSGKSKTRPPLTTTEIEQNMKTYFTQVGRILDTSKAVIAYNSTWLSTLTAADFVQLLGKVTLARIIERDDFAKRLAEHQPIAMHELLYPILQGYDSVALHADIELGGTDQTFNLLMGRLLQEQFQQEPQVVITTPLLEGLDGVHKMSKSLNNAITFSQPADQAFGKLMSMSDELMWKFFKVLLRHDSMHINLQQERVAAGNLHPMELKKEMAYEVICTFWSQAEAIAARESFEALFQKKDYSHAQEIALPPNTPNPIWIVDFLKNMGVTRTSSEAKRLIESNSIQIDNQIISDFKAEITHRTAMIIKIGKHRIYKLQ